MLISLVGKEVNIIWKESQVIQPVLIKSVDLPNNWICLESTDEGKTTCWWTKMDDIDTIQIENQNYDPNESKSTFKAGDFPPDTNFFEEEEMEGSGVKMTMEFLLPQAAPDFYMASHGINAFMALYQISEKIKEKRKKSTTKKEKDVLGELEKDVEKLFSEYQIRFEEGMEE